MSYAFPLDEEEIASAVASDSGIVMGVLAGATVAAVACALVSPVVGRRPGLLCSAALLVWVSVFLACAVTWAVVYRHRDGAAHEVDVLALRVAAAASALEAHLRRPSDALRGVVRSVAYRALDPGTAGTDAAALRLHALHADAPMAGLLFLAAAGGGVGGGGAYTSVAPPDAATGAFAAESVRNATSSLRRRTLRYKAADATLMVMPAAGPPPQDDDDRAFSAQTTAWYLASSALFSPTPSGAGAAAAAAAAASAEHWTGLLEAAEQQGEGENATFPTAGGGLSYGVAAPLRVGAAFAGVAGAEVRLDPVAELMRTTEAAAWLLPAAGSFGVLVTPAWVLVGTTLPEEAVRAEVGGGGGLPAGPLDLASLPAEDSDLRAALLAVSLRHMTLERATRRVTVAAAARDRVVVAHPVVLSSGSAAAVPRLLYIVSVPYSELMGSRDRRATGRLLAAVGAALACGVAVFLCVRIPVQSVTGVAARLETLAWAGKGGGGGGGASDEGGGGGGGASGICEIAAMQGAVGVLGDVRGGTGARVKGRLSVGGGGGGGGSGRASSSLGGNGLGVQPDVEGAGGGVATTRSFSNVVNPDGKMTVGENK